MALAHDLFRGKDHPTDDVVAWLKAREWTITQGLGGAMLASAPTDPLHQYDLMEAVLREICAEQHRLSYDEPPRQRASRRIRINTKPGKGEDLFE